MSHRRRARRPPPDLTQSTTLDNSSKTFLKGLSPTHVAHVMKLQPFYACDWTAKLRDLSNVDKHRHLVRLKGQKGMQISIAIGATGILDTLPNPLGTTVHSAMSPVTGETVYVQHNAQIRIGFDDGSPVLETLEMLRQKVMETIQRFQSEF